MTVLDLLDEIEDLVDKASGVPFVKNKIMVDVDELLEISREIRLSLPDDVQQARWIKDEKERILNEAKAEYEKIIIEAKKQAQYLVENDDITLKARALGENIIKNAEANAKELKMRSYEYIDKMLYDMQNSMDDMSLKYLGEMYAKMQDTFQNVNDILIKNRDEIRGMAYNTQNDEED